MHARARLVRRLSLLTGAALAALAALVAAALLPLASPGTESAPGPTFAMQLDASSPGYDAYPPCLCPICTGYRDRGMEVPADVHTVSLSEGLV